MIKYFFLICGLVKWRHITPQPPYSRLLQQQAHPLLTTACKLCRRGGRCRRFYCILGADYMANLTSARAEILLRLHDEFQPELINIKLHYH